MVKRVHGIVRHFEKGDTGHHHTYYALTLVPSLERLSLRQNSRIFQIKTAQEIVSQMLEEMGVTDYSFTLKRPPHKREFCVQYRETDLNFLHRLAAEEGWVYYFSHEEGKHILNFVDSSLSLATLDFVIPYNSLASDVATAPYISSLTEHKQIQPNQTVLKDYSFKNPSYSFLNQKEGDDMEYQQHIYEHFDAPGRFKNNETGSAFTRIRLEYLRRKAHTLAGTSNEAHIQAGLRITIGQHPDPAINQTWLPVQIQHQGTQPQVLEEGHTGQTTYQNQFTLIPADQNWQDSPQAKPKADGPMIATVVGPTGEEIYCDEYGRVKIHFPWDRESQSDDLSSCWVRVSQGWAGGGYGFTAIPRIGNEVIVSFLDCDPDQPIIIGRTHHVNNEAPYSLPANKTRTVLKTKSHMAEGSNEIRLEDATNEEEIYIHAQKDQNNVVENNETTQVGVDRNETIGNNETINIGNDRTETVGNNETIAVGANRDVTIDSNDTLLIKGNQAETIVIAKAESIGAAKALSIGAGYQITVGASKNESVGMSSTEQVGMLKQIVVGKRFEITCGDSSFVMNADGSIIITGKEVAINGSKHVEVNSKLVDLN